MFGVVKKIDAARGYAFISVDGGADVFANIIENRGVSLTCGDDVEFDLIRIKGEPRARARHVKVLDPLRNYQLAEDRHGWWQARRDSAVIYGSSIEELRFRLSVNPGFHCMNASLKSCDRTPVREIYGSRD